jgi:hypothetical protein
VQTSIVIYNLSQASEVSLALIEAKIEGPST